MVAAQDRQRHAAAVGMLTRMMQEAEARAMQRMPRQPKLSMAGASRGYLGVRTLGHSASHAAPQHGIRFAGQAAPVVRKRATSIGLAGVFRRPVRKSELPEDYLEHFERLDGPPKQQLPAVQERPAFQEPQAVQGEELHALPILAPPSPILDVEEL